MLFAVKQWLLSDIQAVNIVQLVVSSYMFVSTSGKTTIYNCRSMLAFVGSVCIICPHISIHFPRVLRFLRNAGISTAGADGFSRPRGAALQHHQHVCVCVCMSRNHGTELTAMPELVSVDKLSQAAFAFAFAQQKPWECLLCKLCLGIVQTTTCSARRTVQLALALAANAAAVVAAAAVLPGAVLLGAELHRPCHCQSQ